METINYLIFGMAVIFGVLFLHLASLLARNRTLERNLDQLESMQKKLRKRKSSKKRSRR